MNAARLPVAVVIGATSKWQADGRNTRLAHGRALDDRDVVTDPDILRSYTRDRSTGSAAGEPFAVVFPRTTEQVSAVLAADSAARGMARSFIESASGGIC